MPVDPTIRHIEFVLHDMAFLDIIRASQGSSKMGAFILASCFIDYLAGFRYGKQTKGTDYQNFVESYLPNYNAKSLYKDLRCKLVHNYSEGGSYVFADGKATLHGTKLTDGRMIINLETFITDIEGAMARLFVEMEKDAVVRSLAIKRFKHIGLIRIAALFPAK